MPGLHEVLVVAHTHWDREWYHTAERFRQRLVGLIDELLDDPPAAEESFLLDGQAVVLDDYLAVRPERTAELSTLLRDGRIEAGPWYVLADELIPGGEALVRNLLAGRAAVARLRGEPPPVLYCPDSFGHPAALPELAHGFGCALIVIWRGYSGPRWPSGDLLRWRSIAGHDVLVYHLPPDGYEFGSTLPVALEEAGTRWMRVQSVLGPRAVTGTALLLNGADHHARQRAPRGAMEAMAKAAAPVQVRSASLRTAASALVDAGSDAALPTIEGELRDSYGYTWTLQGTLGTRARQKRQAARVERLLVRDVEPWIALCPRTARGAGQRSLLQAAWRTLLLTHPHDTLCGTSIDAVAVAMDERLSSADAQGTGLREDALLQLVGHDPENARSAPASSWRPMVVVRNPAPRPRGGVAELSLSVTTANVPVGPGSGSRQEAPRRVPPWRVDGLPLQVLERGERVALTESPRAYPRADRVATVRALAWVDRVPGYGIVTRAQRGGVGAAPANPVRVDGHSIDNGLLRVAVGADGVVRLISPSSGRTLDDVITLERRRDVGDLYTPALREQVPAPRVRRVRVVHRGPLRGEIAIDYALAPSEGARAGHCRIGLQLDAELPVLRITIDGVNVASDHRLRARVATGLAGSTTLADAAFHPACRASLSIRPEDTAMEAVIPTAPLHRWVARFTDVAGATLYSDGLTEYESLDDGTIAVTLLRAVGQLSRADLPERPGHAGWPADTPGAQSHGPFASQLALMLHGPDSPAERAVIERLADDVLLPLTGATLRSNLAEPAVVPGLELEGEGLVFSAAAPARREGWIVVRCVNRRGERVQGRWIVPWPLAQAIAARLDETELSPRPIDGTSVSFEAAPYEIVTLLLR